MKKVLIIILIIIAIALAYYFFFMEKENPQENENQQLANPASVYCQENGGTSENIELLSGTNSYCVFNDGSRCWEWPYYNGYCKKGDLKIETTGEGAGERADSGNTVTVNYVGKLASDGTQFDSGTYSLTLGEGKVITGWEYGLIGMKVGEKRTLTIGPDLAYGATGAGGVIPPNATLVFEVEMLEIK
jgi:putative hemolysin